MDEEGQKLQKEERNPSRISATENKTIDSSSGLWWFPNQIPT